MERKKNYLFEKFLNFLLIIFSGPMMFLDSPPMPVLGGIDKNSPAAQWFRQLSTQLSLPSLPKAILVITAHWETSNTVHISAQEKHTDLLYDYSGFPSEAYKIKYNPPGDINLSKRVKTLLEQGGISAKLDDKRNFDHGVFIPLKLIYPDANIPVVSISILQNLSPSQHLAIGKALAPLRKEEILIIGSGSFIHGFSGTEKQTNAFIIELTKALTEYNENQREQVLLNWDNVLPYARINHPREEHLIPLHVIVGAAGSDHGQVLNPNVISSQASFKFGV
jgi:aromatic ring-opening dioxygenase catalytic subunit (LigB family)